MENPIATCRRRPRSLFAFLSIGLWLAACGEFSCEEADRAEPAAQPSPEPPQGATREPVPAAETDHQPSTEVSHEPVAGGEDHHDHDHTHESGDHALELDELHGHSPTAVSEEKDRTVLDRLGLRRLPLEDPGSEEH